MKHVSLILSVVAAGVLTLTSCKSEFEQHMMQFAPMKPNMVTYADQTSDTIHVLSTDAWKLTVDDSWLAVTPNEMTPKYKGALYNTLLKFAFTANTNRLTRQTYFHVKGGHTINMPVVQVGWLNISAPAATYKDLNNDKVNDRAYYKVKLDAKATALPFYFTTYTDGAMVQTNAAWIQVPTAAQTAGYHPLSLTITPNTTKFERAGQITLTSAGITDTIEVVQAAAN
ncbi:hypothetical protein HMPREF9332_00564 [Alloprevotella rava F0323]|uniref:BACON domain-containing protein n=1 Tax=Alloprevotella rava F0323 TaxID=679199 RepID=G5GAG3_9BACT|nr:BACON domain-containing carbohydrate-binding protein [Alloprevotella rava]EHG23750.1 hypothetical protein HMPREF9332_00564 [Alloprevotella rava F0323]